jgi:6-pyruvoyltetrahydropterin/6-carboxytetrahydropterin synthase
MDAFEINLGKEDMKFSSAHFTLFDHHLERLHGHNYRVSLSLRAPKLRHGLLLDFGLVKQEARRLCGELDEALLVPATCEDVAIQERDGEIEIRVRGKRYVLPASDCRLLPIANASCECLAEYFCRTLIARLRVDLQAAGAAALAVTVEESPGQSGRCTLELHEPPS